MSGEFKAVSVVVPAGMLGAGVSAEQIEWGLAQGAAAIALDAGSTDSGPSCLATGISKISRDAVKRDLDILLRTGLGRGVPILIGSCGTAGTDSGVDWTSDIAVEIARERGLSFRIALIYSEQDADRLHDRLDAGQICALDPAGPLTHAEIDSCRHIVALLGPEPFAAAVTAGADLILAGRATDTAVLAAVPILRGAGAGPAWHAAKTAECGGLCTANPRGGGVMITVDRDSFVVEPLNPGNRCTAQSVSAHMLYENSDPFHLTEPGGRLDVSDAVYEPLDDRRVRVSGSRFQPMPYTMKLEGARSGPFQTLMIVGIEDPSVLGDLEGFLERMHLRLTDVLRDTYPGEPDFHLSLRPYGWNAVSGRPVPEGHFPHEIGLMLVVTAPSQALATRMAKTINPLFFHFPQRPGIPLPSYGFPFSPAEIERGQVHEFVLNHVVRVSSPDELVRVKTLEVDFSPEATDALPA